MAILTSSGLDWLWELDERFATALTPCSEQAPARGARHQTSDLTRFARWSLVQNHFSE